VPLLRAGLGPWIATPIGGYLLPLRNRGRTSGIIRETPLSSLVTNGAAGVCAGLGPSAHWYRNILADPQAKVVLPGGLGGVNPRRAKDDEILAAYGWVPLIRLRPVDGPPQQDRTIPAGPHGSGARR
jgi:hypothetical protein